MKLSRSWLLLLAVLPLYLTWTFDHSLWNPDETRDAGIASEMHREGRWAVPTLNGEVFLEKPPLYYWSCALVYKLTGQVTAGTTRLPAALFGLLGVLFTFLLGRRLFNERVGLYAALMLATSFQYFRMSHFAMMDVALAAMVTGSLYFYSRGSRIGFAVFTILAFYSKGFLGVILPGIVVTTDLVLQKKFKELFKTIGVGALLFGAFVLPWFWALWKEGGSRYLEIFLIDNHFHRFASNTGDHTEHPWFFYLVSFVGDFMPWTLIFFGFVGALIRGFRTHWDSRSDRFVSIWFFGLLAFFTVSSSKRSIYLLPLFPASALLAGAWLDRALNRDLPFRESKIFYFTTAAIGVITAVAVVGGGFYLNHQIGVAVVTALVLGLLVYKLLAELRAPNRERATLWLMGLFIANLALASFAFVKKMDEEKTFVPLCDAIRANEEGKTLAGFDMSEMERGVFGFYLDRTLLNPRTVDELTQLMAEPGTLLLVTNRNKMKDLAPVLQDKANLVFEYRPQKKTRSYLLYESPDR